MAAARRRANGAAGSRSGNVLNLTGQWQLNKEKSSSMYPHMKAMGCDEIAALASEKLEIILNIVQTDTAITVWQKSQLGITKRMLRLQGETIENSEHGDRRINTNLSLTEMIVDTKFKQGRLVDHRTAKRETDGSLVLCTQLTLTMKDHPEPIKTMRYFVKVGDPDPTVVSIHNQAVASGVFLPATTISASTIRNEAKLAAQAATADEENGGKPPRVPT
mmetsp:Transcript_13644/g.16926  ORF Transcript_13644/g.16926 Transcript_13644/m.16926 type:complete len:219 (-) Transcript_13644:352-1008(-)|eukprot:CAMPEP_0204830812 /NCGR_PEP_ID=MMETSP1346-20131115/9325_1 /ASSEMBLY_ACC=CAM_ASM_000771 /TAXON_ID=215587 /ORGANISM="Aplanochytrium stocchinoi, Strain GSBS06" /LENGTH=218 /DNA_ID=CAMNT_0051961365 /DNA_START=33 /DNA_END=689 /DNA_ORIENTATION=+